MQQHKKVLQDAELDDDSKSTTVGTELYDWIEQSKPKHLKKGEFDLWPIGHQEKIVLFDRNFEEYGIWDEMKENVADDPIRFFRFNTFTATKTGPYCWQLDGIMENQNFRIELDIANLGTGWNWAPVNKEGEIKLTSTVKNWKVTEIKNPNIIPWKAFNDSTRIGWRGPAIKLIDIKEFGPVYFKPFN